MSIFAAMIDDLFGDPHLARDAIWRAGGSGSGVAVRIIRRQPDRIGSFGEARLWAATTMIEVRTAEVPLLAEGDSFETAGETFAVQGEPLRDGERLVWTAEVRLA